MTICDNNKNKEYEKIIKDLIEFLEEKNITLLNKYTIQLKKLLKQDYGKVFIE